MAGRASRRSALRNRCRARRARFCRFEVRPGFNGSRVERTARHQYLENELGLLFSLFVFRKIGLCALNVAFIFLFRLVFFEVCGCSLGFSMAFFRFVSEMVWCTFL